MSIKQFEVAAKPKAEKDEGIPFEIPDPVDEGKEQTFTQIVAYQPDEGQFAMLMAATGRGATDTDRIAGAINFLVNIVNKRGADYLQARLLDREDEFGIEDVENIMEWLVEEWTGNPTVEPSGSTPSPSTAGPKSTGSIL